MKKHHIFLPFPRLALLVALLSSNLLAQQPSEKQLEKILKRFPEADIDKDGKLSLEEIEAVQQEFRQSRQGKAPSALEQPKQAVDPKLLETLAGMNAGFKNVKLEIYEWPDELQKKLGQIKKLAYIARPVGEISGKLPLIINLHGGGARWWNMSAEQQLEFSAEGKMMRGFDMAEMADKDLIVLEPNTAGLWDAKSLNMILDYVLENFSEVDRERIYLIGYSMGGKGAWVWINKSAERFAAASLGGFGGGAQGGDLDKLANLPIWGMAGSNDGKNTTGMRLMVQRLKDAGNVNVKHTEFEGANHNEGNKAMFSMLDLVDWLLGFKRLKTTE